MIKHVLLFISILFNMVCNANNIKNTMSLGEEILVDREPAVAGSFYESNPQMLKNQLAIFFDIVKDKGHYENLRALVVPHAGFVYSGEVAANAYSLIDPSHHYKNVFIIASSHRAYFEGASIYSVGDYITPLGKVKVNRELAQRLIKENNCFSYHNTAHVEEHSIEVQLPFIQYVMGEKLNIVPIVIGEQNPKVSEDIAKALRPYFNGENLFVISSDFSHYPNSKDAEIYDKETANAIVKNSTTAFIKTLSDHEQKGIPGLSTSACGWTSILTLLELTENDNIYNYRHIIYKNSGQYVSKNRNRVVGYNAIALFENRDEKENASERMEFSFSLSDNSQAMLLKIARESIVYYLEKGKIPTIPMGEVNDEIMMESGTFVTLHKNGDLRGCIGRFTTNDPLYETVQKMAIAAATQDYRFNIVKSSELKDIDIEISVLSPLRRINSIDEIILGKHGIYISKGSSHGTFLPQVATDTGWNLEDFLGHCARDKAGIGWSGWKEADIYVYEAFVFGEHKIK